MYIQRVCKLDIPDAHELWAVEPAGQYVPLSQSVAVVALQKESEGHATQLVRPVALAKVPDVHE